MIIKKKVSIKTEEELLAEKAAKEAEQQAEEEAKRLEEERKKQEEEIGFFDIDKIDFTQRNERRTGNRRRGYRRIDDRNLVSRAQEEADQIRQTAYQEGYNAGVQQAQAEIGNFQNILGAFMSAEEKVFNEIAPNILELAMEIATKIIKHEVKTDPQIVIDTVMDVMRTLSKNEPKIILRINPIQVQYVKDILPEQIRLLGMETKLSVLSDENISEGGCIIQTNNGVVDATVEAQLEIVKNALRSIE